MSFRSPSMRKLARTLASSALILLCLEAGEALGPISTKAGFTLPGSVIGMVLLFMLLLTGIVQLEPIEGVAGFLLDYLGLFFVPAGVALLARWQDLRDHWLLVPITIVVSTIIVLVCTGMTAHFLERRNDER